MIRLKVIFCILSFLTMSCTRLKDSSTEGALSQTPQEKFQVTKILCLKKPVASLNLELDKDGTRKIKDYLNENDLVAFRENLLPNRVWKKAFYLVRTKSRIASGLIEHSDQNFVECPEDLAHLKSMLYLDIKAENGEYQRNVPLEIKSQFLGEDCSKIASTEIFENNESPTLDTQNQILFSPETFAAELDKFIKWYCLNTRASSEDQTLLQKRSIDALNAYFNYMRLFSELHLKLPEEFYSHSIRDLRFDFVTLLSIVFASELSLVLEFVDKNDSEYDKYQEFVYEVFIRNLGQICKNNQHQEKGCSPFALLNFLQSKQGWYDMPHSPKRYLAQLVKAIEIRPLMGRFLNERTWFEEGAIADRPYEWGNYSCTSDESLNKGFRVLEKASKNRPITLDICGSSKKIPFVLYKCRPGINLNQFFVIITAEQSNHTCNPLGATNAKPSGPTGICKCNSEFKYFGD